MALISVADAATRYKLSAPHIRRLVAAGVVKGRLFGKTWALNEGSLKAYLRKERRRGPKPKKRRTAT